MITTANYLLVCI